MFYGPIGRYLQKLKKKRPKCIKRASIRRPFLIQSLEKIDGNSGKHATWSWRKNCPLPPNTSFDIKIKGFETGIFQRNNGSPQGDSISGIFFNKYMGDSLRCARGEFNLKKSYIEHCKTDKFRLSKGIKSKTKKEKDNMIETVIAVFLSRNLKVNEDNKNTPFYNLQIATQNHGGTSRK